MTARRDEVRAQLERLPLAGPASGRRLAQILGLPAGDGTVKRALRAAVADGSMQRTPDGYVLAGVEWLETPLGDPAWFTPAQARACACARPLVVDHEDDRPRCTRCGHAISQEATDG